MTLGGRMPLDEIWQQIAGGFPIVPCQCSGTNALTLTPILNEVGGDNVGNYMAWSFVAANNSTGLVTANIGTIGSLNVYKDGGVNQAGAGDIIANRLYVLVYNSALNAGTGGYVLFAGMPSLTATNVVALPTGYLFGLTLSQASTTSVGIAAGSCRDSTDADNMVLGSAVTKTTGAWAAGSGNGGLDTGSIAATTWYHVHVIKQPGGLAGGVDALVSLSATSPTMPTGYTLPRRIGSVLTDGSKHIIAFQQDGDRFRWKANVQDVSSLNPGTSAVTVALSVPTGVVTWADIAVTINNGTSSNVFGLVSSLDETDSGPTGGTANFSAGQTTTTEIFGGLLIKCNTSGQLRYRISASGANDRVIINTFGWVDQRGRQY